jgi:hypothetical protein
MFLLEEAGMNEEYLVRYWLYHLSLAIETDNDGGSSALSAFLQQPYPVHHSSNTGMMRYAYPAHVSDSWLHEVWRIHAVLAIDAKASFRPFSSDLHFVNIMCLGSRDPLSRSLATEDRKGAEIRDL